MAKNKLTIPQIRGRLHELAEEHGIDELHFLAAQTWRKTAVHRAPARSQPLTPELAAKIRDYKIANPNAHQQDIAAHYGVNPGRISEALNQQV